MHKIIFIIALFVTTEAIAQVGIGTVSPATSSMLDVTSTDKGFLPPRMTTAQRDAITNPAAGLMIFNTTTSCTEIYRGSSWFNICTSSFVSSAFGKLLGGTGTDQPNTIRQTADGGYIIAGTSASSNNGTLAGLTSNGTNDAWILKLNSAGNIQWQKLLGGSLVEEIYSARQTSDGGFIFAGYSSSSNTGTLTGVTSNGANDCWILKLDENGNTQWQKLFGGTGNDQARCIEQTTDGGFIVTGNSSSSNTGTLTGTFSNGSGDMFVLKITESGVVQWQKLFGAAGSDNGNSIAQTSDGGYIVGGLAGSGSSNNGTITGLTSNGLIDCLVVKLDATGTIVWQRLIGGTQNDEARSVVPTRDGGYIVAGIANSSNTGTLVGIGNNGLVDYWIIKLDAGGAITWQKLLGGSGNDQPVAIQQSADGEYIVAGYSTTTNSGTLTGVTNHGGYDFWVVKLTSTGNVNWQRLLGGNANDFGYSLHTTLDGGYVITGTSASSNNGSLLGFNNNGGDDYWIIKLDQNGN